MELSDELYAQITKHTDIGEHYFEEGKYRKSLEEYKKAFELIPEPKTNWEASVWTLAAIGDAHFMLREFVSALKIFEQLMNEYHEEENPFTRVRYVQCLWRQEMLSWRGSTCLPHTRWKAMSSSITTSTEKQSRI